MRRIEGNNVICRQESGACVSKELHHDETRIQKQSKQIERPLRMRCLFGFWFDIDKNQHGQDDSLQECKRRMQEGIAQREETGKERERRTNTPTFYVDTSRSNKLHMANTTEAVAETETANENAEGKRGQRLCRLNSGV